jgi:hypothetical protein
MFDYPLPIPRCTLYHRLVLDPWASTEEILEIKAELIGRLTQEKSGITQKLNTLYAELPKLKQPDLDAQERTRLEQRALGILPDYYALREREQQLDEEINELNQLPLLKPETRLTYDRRTPPLELLKLADAAPDWFFDNRLALALLRREVADFLASRGEPAYHPSDLTRTDFSGDFTYHPHVDGPEPWPPAEGSEEEPER